MNSIFELGRPDVLCPLELVKIFEQQTGTTFAVERVPQEAIQAQKMELLIH